MTLQMDETLKNRYQIEYRLDKNDLSVQIRFHNDMTNYSQISASCVQVTRKQNETDEQLKIRALEYLTRWMFSRNCTRCS